MDSRARGLHNDRRRKNRAIKAAVLAAARAAGYPADELERLKAAGPKEVKDWAAARGCTPEGFLATRPPVLPPPGPVAPAGNAVAGAAHGEAPAVPDELRVAEPAGQPGPGRPPTGTFERDVRAIFGRVVEEAARQVAAQEQKGGHAHPKKAAGRAPQPRQHEEAPAPQRPREPWSTPELEQQLTTIRSRQGSHRDERSLLSGRPTKVQPVAQGGINTTKRVELDNGMTGYFKPFGGLEEKGIAEAFGQGSAQQPVHEAAAWMLASKMGRPYEDLVPPCVIREVDGQLGSFAVERPGKTRMAHRISAETTPEYDAAAFFDALIGQQDRHQGNFLVAGDRVALIDHGFSFARSGDHCNFSMLQGQREIRSPQLTPAEKASLDALLASPDLHGLAGVLEPERATALRQRAELMRVTGRICGRGEY